MDFMNGFLKFLMCWIFYHPYCFFFLQWGGGDWRGVGGVISLNVLLNLIKSGQCLTVQQQNHIITGSIPSPSVWNLHVLPVGEFSFHSAKTCRIRSKVNSKL